MAGHVQPKSLVLQEVVQGWLKDAAARWEKAVSTSPPDFEALHDIPHLPGHVSYKDFLDYIRNAHIYQYPRPSVTVDNVVFGLDEDTLKVLLIRRGRHGTAFEGCWALPGGFVDPDEDLEVAARRELREEGGAQPSYIEQLGTFGKPGRDPRGHVISVAYMSLVRCNDIAIQSGDDADDARWWDMNALPKLAFDHAEILEVALKRLRTKIRWQPVGINLLPVMFTLSDLQKVYETLLGHPLDKRNFRRKILSYGILDVATSRQIHDRGRATTLYRFDEAAYNELLEQGMAFEV